MTTTVRHTKNAEVKPNYESVINGLRDLMDRVPKNHYLHIEPKLGNSEALILAVMWDEEVHVEKGD